jgi:hypothetical protein
MRSLLYRLARLLGDYNAVRRGRIGRLKGTQTSDSASNSEFILMDEASQDFAPSNARPTRIHALRAPWPRRGRGFPHVENVMSGRFKLLSARTAGGSRDEASVRICNETETFPVQSPLEIRQPGPGEGRHDRDTKGATG